MICYLVTARHASTMGEYLASWGASVASRVRIVSYESLLHRRSIPSAGVYIFSDIERLGAGRRSVAQQVHHALKRDRATVLNDPGRTSCRYELLRRLHAAGRNRFRAHRLDEARQKVRYPVFLRREDEHTGALTRLLHDPQQVDQAISLLKRRGFPVDRLLITEFCDTADSSGVYRKYAAFVVKGTVIPRHLLFGRSWMLKKPELFDEALMQEQRAFIADNPHADQLREICAELHVSYGRVDYSVVDGEIQVWEINTNPTVTQGRYRRLRDRSIHETFATRFGQAMQQLDEQAEDIAPCPVRFSRRTGRAVLVERMSEYLVKRRFKLMRRLLPGSPLLAPPRK